MHFLKPASIKNPGKKNGHKNIHAQAFSQI